MIGSTLSDLYDQEQGVPKGSILSTTLFNIKINNIVHCLDNKTAGSLYVDDFGICYRSKNMRTIERHLQQSINRIEDWATNNGFKFSKRSAFIFVNLEEFTMIQFFTYMDLQYLLLRNQNFLE